MAPTLHAILPLRGIVLLPGMIRPVAVGRPATRRALRAAEDGARLVAIPQIDPDEEDALRAAFPTMGVEARLVEVVWLPDGQASVLLEGVQRMHRDGDPTEEDGVLLAPFRPHADPPVDPDDLAAAATLDGVLREFTGAEGLRDDEHDVVVSPTDDPGRVAEHAAQLLDLTWAQRLEILEAPTVHDRLTLLLDAAATAIAARRLSLEMEGRVQQAMDRSQREYHLREQIKALRAELGDAGPEDEADDFEQRIKDAGMPEEAEKEAMREVHRLRRIASDSAEHHIARTWLETVCSFPWSTTTDDDNSLAHAQEVLDTDHHGLDEVKERILEYLAVRQLRADAQGAILCMVGAPGVGKTSLGRSVARALGRGFARVSLGGIKDESEIRGHRRTYIGAMPGRIVQALIRAGSRNPVLVLDEIDKVGADVRGDPASALLEVLDPAQNKAFTDHYLDLPVDLSQVLFLATANLVDPIPLALYDRFEILEIPGYTEEEKVTIAFQHLLPRQASEHGLREDQLHISDKAMHRIVQDHTREAGLRNLDRQLARVCRKVARQVTEGRTRPARIQPGNLEKWLGPPRYFLDVDDRDDQPGVVIGLAWTATGGDILYIECLQMPGRAGLKLTGSLGDVMKESAEAARSWLLAHHDRLGLTPESFDSLLHLHVPAGAIPKDGPSAGVSMLTALASRLTGRAVRPGLAMTGEITLRGKVLPVGGIKEKVLAARRAGVREILIPRHNEKDLIDIPKEARRDLTLHTVDTIDEVLALALVSPRS